MRSTLPMNAIAIALGLHVRVGIEDNLWSPRKERFTSVQQVEQIVCIADELGRDNATPQEAKHFYRIGEYWSGADATLDHLGLPPNHRPGQRGVPLRHPAGPLWERGPAPHHGHHGGQMLNLAVMLEHSSRTTPDRDAMVSGDRVAEPSSASRHPDGHDSDAPRRAG